MASATPEQIQARLSRLTPAQRQSYDSVMQANEPADPSWTHPTYTGTDAAYQQWLAAANLQGTDANSQARLRKQQAQQAYEQALTDLMRQGETGRRTIQSNMLARGMFNSGETDRRKLEFDALIEQGKSRAAQAEQDQFGQIADTQRTALSNLSMQGATQVSAAMMRDSLAAYEAQKQAASQTYTPPAPQQPQPTYTAPLYQPPQQTAPPANAKPIKNSASLSNASSAKPKPVVQPKLTRIGLS